MSNPNQNQYSSPPPKIPTDKEIERIIKETNVESVRSLVDAAEGFGKYIAADKAHKDREVTTSQIRNVYGTVKKLEMKVSMNGWKDETRSQLLLLKPLLAYAAGRHEKGMIPLKDVISKAIDCVTEDEKTFKRFCQFFEAIIAYHKANGGKD